MAYCVFIRKADSIYDDIPAERYQFPAQYLGRAEPCIGEWRLRAFLAGIAIAAMLTACSNQPSREDLEGQVEELQSRVEELEGENANLRMQLDEAHGKASESVAAATMAKNAAEEAQSEARRFSFEDWQYVVPNIQAATDDAVDAAGSAANAAEEVEAAASVD
jgi:hypothetical protein